MQWVVSIIILIVAVWLVPISVTSTKHSRKGRIGGAMTGIADALDPARALIVAEMEKRQRQVGEETDGDDEPVASANELPPSPSISPDAPPDHRGSDMTGRIASPSRQV